MNAIPTPNKASSVTKPTGYVTAPRSRRSSKATDSAPARNLSEFKRGVTEPLSFPKNVLSEPLATRSLKTAPRSTRYGAKT